VTGVEGALLAGLFVAYTAYLVRDERTARSIDTEYADSRVTGAIPDGLSERGRDALLLVGGLALVLVSGHFMVEAASTLARSAGVSDWAIGGTIVAAGTSTPELAVSLVAMRRGHVGMSVETSSEQRVQRARNYGDRGLPPAARGRRAAIETVLWLTVVTVVMVVALWSGRRLSRTEGAPSSSAPR